MAHCIMNKGRGKRGGRSGDGVSAEVSAAELFEFYRSLVSHAPERRHIEFLVLENERYREACVFSIGILRRVLEKYRVLPSLNHGEFEPLKALKSVVHSEVKGEYQLRFEQLQLAAYDVIDLLENAVPKA